MRNGALRELSDAIVEFNAALTEITVSLEQKCSEPDYPWIVFSVGDKYYAISGSRAKSIAVLEEVLPSGDAPAYLPGTVMLNRAPLRLLDAHALFGTDKNISRKHNGYPMVIVVLIGSVRYGLIVDRVASVEYFKSIAGTRPSVDSVSGRHIRGAVQCGFLNKPVLIINEEALVPLLAGREERKNDRPRHCSSAK